ncbi:hypothetical protein EW145_g6256 [Phellinidium pouzarii]|uniref:Uncharacterized protein n=1 Tax=Phellinidium pouzarii TaxID=167371 RepID=A0A4S4KX73_9AGAM|nr:hypothetical protein EW145_g6256 [Phellinidium pouzarii]
MAFACRRAALSLGSSNTTYILCRSIATTSRHAERKGPPESPTFYTGRGAFYDYVANLERAVHYTRTTLKGLQLSPLPDFARRSLPPSASSWKTKDELAVTLSAKLSSSRHRRIVNLLTELADFRRIASIAGHLELSKGLDGVLELFERVVDEDAPVRGLRKPIKVDAEGRAYALGRRKTSSARVWVISSDHATAARARAGDTSPPVTEILVNNAALNEYFKIPVDRERILRPFRITGLLGAFNVFALVRSGGISGQAGAVALGIARCLAAHVPDVEHILRRAKLLHRDPRMVERKHTGRAKARKGYTWVKR